MLRPCATPGCDMPVASQTNPEMYADCLLDIQELGQPARATEDYYCEECVHSRYESHRSIPFSGTDT